MAQIKVLHQQLAASFNEGELRTLSMDLCDDYDSLPGQGKSDKARELILYLQRRQKMSQLLEMLEESRPKVNWAELFGTAEITDQTISSNNNDKNEAPAQAKDAETSKTAEVIIDGGQIGQIIHAENIESVSGDFSFGDYSDKNSGE